MLFSTIKVVDSKPQALMRHLDKLFKSYSKLGLALPSFSLDGLFEFLSQKAYQKGTWRLNIKVNQEHQTYFEMYPYLSSLASEVSLKNYSKPFYESKAQVKKMNFSLRESLLKEAQALHYDDWIFVNDQHHLLETCISNLFWTDAKTFYLPDPSLPYYLGVTLEIMMEVAQTMGYHLSFVKERPEKLKRGYSLFICNSMKGILGVEQMDEEKISIDKTLLKKFQKGFLEFVSKEDAF